MLLWSTLTHEATDREAASRKTATAIKSYQAARSCRNDSRSLGLNAAISDCARHRGVGRFGEHEYGSHGMNGRVALVTGGGRGIGAERERRPNPNGGVTEQVWRERAAIYPQNRVPERCGRVSFLAVPRP